MLGELADGDLVIDTGESWKEPRLCPPSGRNNPPTNQPKDFSKKIG